MTTPLLPLLGLCLSPLTLPDAVDRALKRDSTLAGLDAQARGADASTDALRGNYGPKLRLEGNVIVWDDAQTVSFGGGGGNAAAALPPPATPYEFALAGLLQGFGTPTTVREQVTAQATVQVVQPLVGLYAISQGVEASEAGRAAIGAQQQSRRQRVELETVQAYFRVLQAQGLARAAAQQVESLAAQEKRMLSLQANGVVAKNDVLRLQVALAAARQQVIATQGMEQQARAALGMYLGAQPGESFELTADEPAFAAAAVPPLASARENALRDRPELTELEHRVAQTSAGEDAARAKMLPELNFIAQYQHAEGNTFSAADSFFGGLFLSWTAWEWGATARQVDAAEAQREATQAMREQARKGIALEVEAAHVQMDTADHAIAVAEGAVAQAEEALRLERARLEAQQSTTTDLINAETALLQARVNLENARWERLMARARLRTAMGRSVLEARDVVSSSTVSSPPQSPLSGAEK